jgi:hypothetical protein
MPSFSRKSGGHPGRDQAVTDTPAVPGSTSAWIQNTVLALDLDLTLIRPAPVFEPRPSPFPLTPAAELRLKSDFGQRYWVRSGLDALERILQHPWKLKMVWSMSAQDKVDEVTRGVKIGRRTLEEWTDACVGSELLNAFAEARGFSLKSHREMTLSNPAGRPVRAKPSQFLQLRNLQSLGRSLRQRDRAAALSIATGGELQYCRGLVIDDQPYLEPSQPAVICYQIFPFLDIEDIEGICPRTDQSSPLLFNFLDHMWRLISLPLHFLAHLLNRHPRWLEFRRRLNTERQITDALRQADSIQQFRWFRTGSPSSQYYRDYLRTRRSLEKGLERARYRQQATVYRTLVEDYVAADVREGWDVLFLGRDMDYAFDFIRYLYPGFVEQGKVALLPLSRSALLQTDDECLLSLLCRSLPGLRSNTSVGLRIYDVGFHGRIPARISQVMRRHAWTLTKRVEARLLNRCSCPTDQTIDCTGELIRFVDWRGEFSMPRDFGISIERCPHRTGSLQQIARNSEGFEFRFSPQHSSEKRRAVQLEELIKCEALEGSNRLRNHPDIVKSVAYQAYQHLVRTAPQNLRLVRRNASLLYGLSNWPQNEAVRVVVYPFCGTDVLTPFLCFPNLTRLFLIDQIPASPDFCELDTMATALYLADLVASFQENFIQPPFELNTIRKNWSIHLPSIDESHALALVSTLVLMSLARLMPESEWRVGQVKSGTSSQSRFSWTVEFSDGHCSSVEYVTHRVGVQDEKVCERLQEYLQASPSALILKGGAEFLRGRALPTLETWSRNASLLLLDHETAALGQYRASSTLRQPFGLLDSTPRSSIRSGDNPPPHSFHLYVRR